jgi:arsenite methyltransferase
LESCRIPHTIDALQTAGEDYGYAAVYRRAIPNHADRFVLDNHHDIETGRFSPVCGNTWHMPRGMRFVPHFDFIGDFSRHFGLL